RYLRNAAIAVVLIGYPVAAHFISAAPPTAHLGIVTFAFAPLFVAVTVVGWQAHFRVATVVAAAAAFALLWLYSGVIGRNLALVYFIESTCTNAALGILFGRTLFGGREPLCSQFARFVRGPLEPRVARYSRQITVAWMLYFVAMMVVSIALYVLAPIPVWSTFANLLSLPLLALMFIAEYAIRIRVLPDLPHKPILESVRAFRNSPRATTTPPR
ncbi:MAG: hypothetical protein ABIS68_04105, partial [Casimicrobiaceae bacterium]